jgi:serine/threonine protein kinase
LNGLYNLHTIGIYHRDIKPANIFIEKNNNNFNFVLGDFGFCDINKTNNDSVGSPLYMSPI